MTKRVLHFCLLYCLLFLPVTAIHAVRGSAIHAVQGSAVPPSFILKREYFRTAMSCIHISPDGSLLLAGFQDGSFSLLDTGSFEPVLEVREAHLKAVNAMDMPPKMDFVLTAGSNSIFLWDRAGNKLTAWAGHATTIWNAEISKNGKYAVSSAFNKTLEQRAR